MTTDELKQACLDKISVAYRECEAMYSKTFTRPTITFDLTGRVAGMAFYYRNKIRLNLQLLIENGENFINDTPAHEAAHLIAFALHGINIKPHGSEWRKVMLDIGQTPNRCHDFKTTPARIHKKHIYFCACGEHKVSTTIHNRILIRGRKYICRKCGAYLKWEKYEKAKQKIVVCA